MTGSLPPSATRIRPVRALRRCAALGGLLLLGACAASQPQVAAAPQAPMDPLTAFAAEAVPGSQARITLADGQSTNVRLARSYFAASGRECREVLVGSGTLARQQLVCRTEGGGWAASRPLLRGAGPIRQ